MNSPAYAVYVSEQAYQKIDDFSQVSRPVMDALFEQLCQLEQLGVPPKSLVISDLSDSQGLTVNGYLVEAGQFSLVITCEEGQKIIIWDVRVRPSEI